MKYLVYVEVLITKPENTIKTLKFEVSAKSNQEAIDKVAKIHYTKGLLGKEYKYTPVHVYSERGTFWYWNAMYFDTLKQAKACIEGDYNSRIKNLLEYAGYSKITKLVNGIETSVVNISVDENGYAVFSKVEKIPSNLPTLA